MQANTTTIIVLRPIKSIPDISQREICFDWKDPKFKCFFTSLIIMFVITAGSIALIAYGAVINTIYYPPINSIQGNVTGTSVWTEWIQYSWIFTVNCNDTIKTAYSYQLVPIGQTVTVIDCLNNQSYVNIDNCSMQNSSTFTFVFTGVLIFIFICVSLCFLIVNGCRKGACYEHCSETV